jgi:hypothetical protein
MICYRSQRLSCLLLRWWASSLADRENVCYGGAEARLVMRLRGPPAQQSVRSSPSSALRCCSRSWIWAGHVIALQPTPAAMVRPKIAAMTITRPKHGTAADSAHTDFRTTASTQEKVQGDECCDCKRGNDHEHDLHRISSSQDSPLFVARSPLSDKRGHSLCSPINAGCSPCVLQSTT